MVSNAITFKALACHCFRSTEFDHEIVKCLFTHAAPNGKAAVPGKEELFSVLCGVGLAAPPDLLQLALTYLCSMTEKEICIKFKYDQCYFP